jgi:hypothetical protein
LDLFKTIYVILLLEGLAVHPKLFRGPLVDRDRRLAQGWPTQCALVQVLLPETSQASFKMSPSLFIKYAGTFMIYHLPCARSPVYHVQWFGTFCYKAEENTYRLRSTTVFLFHVLQSQLPSKRYLSFDNVIPVQGRGVHVTGVSAAYTFKLNKNILSE